MFSAKWLATVLVLCLLIEPARAQVTTADIVGRVSDSTGAVLPGVSVTIENTATHTTRTQTTSETGDYVFNLLPVGPYTVKMELQGFQTMNAQVNLSTGD